MHAAPSEPYPYGHKSHSHSYTCATSKGVRVMHTHTSPLLFHSLEREWEGSEVVFQIGYFLSPLSRTRHHASEAGREKSRADQLVEIESRRKIPTIELVK
ncbi:hypothetical protein AMTRI_Chr12g270730 [Amborella trichopoda]